MGSHTIPTSGFSTLELLIAFCILTLSLTSVILVVFGEQSITLDTHLSQKLLYQSKNELLRIEADSVIDFNLIHSGTSTKQFNSLSYTHEMYVEQFDLFTKKVRSILRTNTDLDHEQKIALTTFLTNPQALNGGDTCSSELTGDWTRPVKTEYQIGNDILHDPLSIFPISALQLFNEKLYIGISNTSGTNKDTFFTFDVANGSNPPILIGRIDNNSAVAAGINDIAVDGDQYIYLANAYQNANFTTCNNANGTNPSCSNLQILDTNQQPPLIIYSYKVPTIAGINVSATKVIYRNGLIYLGLTKASGPEFNIIDVGGGGIQDASPSNPKTLGNFEIGNAVNAMYLQYPYIYIASPNDEELIILDVHDPGNPSKVAKYNAVGGSANNGNGKSIAIVGSTLHLGRTLLTGDEFYILDISNKDADPVRFGSKNIVSGSTNLSVNGVIVRDYLAFLLTNTQLKILNIKDLQNIADHSFPLTLPPGGTGMSSVAMDCENNSIFLGSVGSDNKGYITIVNATP